MVGNSIGSDGISGGDATEHNCGVVGVIGVLGVGALLIWVETRTFIGFSSFNSRDRFGTRPYLTAENSELKKQQKLHLFRVQSIYL